MTDLLIAFVIPVLVIVVSAILQTILNCPFKVAGVVFVIAIIIALVLGGTTLLIALAWIYTLLAFVVAYIICRFFRWECNSNRNCNCCSGNNENNNSGNGNTGNNNSGNNNTGNGNIGNNNSGNNNTGNNNSGNNNTGNNNSGNNNTGNNNGNNNSNRCCRCLRG